MVAALHRHKEDLRSIGRLGDCGKSRGYFCAVDVPDKVRTLKATHTLASSQSRSKGHLIDVLNGQGLNFCIFGQIKNHIAGPAVVAITLHKAESVELDQSAPLDESQERGNVQSPVYPNSQPEIRFYLTPRFHNFSPTKGLNKRLWATQTPRASVRAN